MALKIVLDPGSLSARSPTFSVPVGQTATIGLYVATDAPYDVPNNVHYDVYLVTPGKPVAPLELASGELTRQLPSGDYYVIRTHGGSISDGAEGSVPTDTGVFVYL